MTLKELKNELLDTCNNSNLPLDAVIFVLKDLWRDAEDTLRVLEEQQKKQAEEKEEQG